VLRRSERPFFALAAYVTVEAVRTLLGVEEAERSTVAIVPVAVSAVVMPFLSLAQRCAGRELGSASAVADSKQTLLCTYLCAAVLVGMVLNTALGSGGPTLRPRWCSQWSRWGEAGRRGAGTCAAPRRRSGLASRAGMLRRLLLVTVRLGSPRVVSPGRCLAPGSAAPGWDANRRPRSAARVRAPARHHDRAWLTAGTGSLTLPTEGEQPHDRPGLRRTADRYRQCGSSSIPARSVGQRCAGLVPIERRCPALAVPISQASIWALKSNGEVNVRPGRNEVSK
jgi:hypothetical protein